MNNRVSYVAVCLAIVCAGAAASAWAGASFVVADPPVACGVIDRVPFDGMGDTGPFDYDTVLLGTQGEKRAMAEFDISAFTLPPGEQISSAIFEVQVYSDYCGGLGAPYGLLPNTLAVDGYVGNGLAELSDFEAGNGNFLVRVVSSSVHYGDVLSFDVTPFVSQLVSAGHSWVGLTVRAEQIGSLSIWDGMPGYPRLTITTTPIPEPAGLAALALGTACLYRRR